MSDPEDTFTCPGCASPGRTDDCGHADEPTCAGCCEDDHADELLRTQLNGCWMCSGDGRLPVSGGTVACDVCKGAVA